MAKNYKYKTELEAQLQEKNKTARFEEAMKHNPDEQKTLEENYLKFEQKEYDRINNGRERTKFIMTENKYHIMQKQTEKDQMDRQDKDVFNRQALEDKLHAERNAEEKRRFKDWQKEALKHDYEEQIKRKQQMGQMEKLKEQDYASQYQQNVETFANNNHRTLETLRERNAKIMASQQATHIPDANDQRKLDAVKNMTKQFESTEKKTLKDEFQRLNKKHNDEIQTTSVLKTQMDARRKRTQTEKVDDKYYKTYVENTLNLLSERDRKVKEDREKLKLDYAKDLESQIKEQKYKEKVMYNEMDDKVLKLNQRNLLNYETGEKNKDMFRLPGLNRDEADNREYFGRYAREKKPSKLATEMGLGLKIGETHSYTSRKPASVRRDPNGLGNSFNKYQSMPKTSMEDGSRRHRPIVSPNYNILKNQNLTDREDGPKRNLAKYRSMVDLQALTKQAPVAEQTPEPVSTHSKTLLSPRTRDQPEYEPSKRDENQRRSIMNSTVSKSVAQLNTQNTQSGYNTQAMPSAPVEKALPKYEAPKTVVAPQSEAENRFEKIKKVPESLIDVNKELNSRIMGGLRNGNLRTSVDNLTYGQKKEEPSYKGPIG